MKAKELREIALRALSGVGDEARQWEQARPAAFHLRRRLTAAEEAITGPAIDYRGTAEAKFRAINMGVHLARIPRELLAEDLNRPR